MRREYAFLMDMLTAADELAEFVSGTDEARFLSSKPEQSFVFHRMVILGEAANAVPAEMRARYPELPWARLVALRNRLVHAYFDLDVPVLWNLASTQVVGLRQMIAGILRAEFPQPTEGEAGP
jgi:uncharacterized protein with HEPN domain